MHDALLAAVDLRGLEALHEIDGLGDARLQFRKRRLGVCEARHFDSGEARNAPLRRVGRNLDLPRQGEHVGREARIDEDGGIDLLGLGMRGALGEDGGEILQPAQEHGDRGLVHRECHGVDSQNEVQRFAT